MASFVISMMVGWAVGATGTGNQKSWIRRATILTGWVLPFVLFVFTVLTFSVNVPYWDDYDAILSYLLYPMPDRMKHLFAFHNEHRIMFVRLVVEVVYAIRDVFDFRLMIYLGNTLFLIYVLCVWYRFKQYGTQAKKWFMPAAWALLSILMYENTLWALTAVHSNAVLLFAWLSLLCLERKREKNIGWFLLSLFFAFLCTYTSGSGLFIWFCMAGMLLKQRFLDFTTEEEKQRPRVEWVVKLMFLSLIAMGSIGFYLSGFKGAGESPLTVFLRNPFGICAYGIMFCGAALHFPFLAFPAGLCVVGLVVVFILRVPRIRDNVVFFYLCFLLCAIGSAALFRGADSGVIQALSSRYRIIAVSVLICSGLLAYEQFGCFFRWDMRFAYTGVTVFIVFLNISASLLAYPLLQAKCRSRVEGIKKWPEDNSGLIYPDRGKASRILLESVQCGSYFPPR